MKLAIIGGHLSPALSIIQNLPKNWEVVFIGRKMVFEGDDSLSLEYLTIEKLGIPFENLTTGRLQRKFTRNTITSLFKIPIGLKNALAILRKQKPDAILGFGTYLQPPIVLAATILGIPVIIHEQTLEAGFSNKVCAKFAKKICISWESSRPFFPKEKIILTGIPIREETIKASVEKSAEKNEIPQIFIAGGSSGSHFINQLIAPILENLLTDYKIIHQTGDSREFKDFEYLSNLRSKFSEKSRRNYTLEKFIEPDKFPFILKDSSLMISRAGMNTISELLFLKKPCILIPIPFSQKKEQLKNAEYLSKAGLAVVIEQKNATSTLLNQKIINMLENIDKFSLKEVENVSKNASDKIIKVIEECIEEK